MRGLEATAGRAREIPAKPCFCSTVGASLLAMVVNDNAGNLMPRGVRGSIASRLAPTGVVIHKI
ncbi:hypothetical protein DKY63_00890 [Pseudomonas putida]|uniref:Uncharacterized protein n=1 Tax=Pseudomonas putida TaxID=303 RepID=A0A2Z4RBP7_PSEPU|nr:hypothetical protein DKY63_00890 [Pseudomonas putida]